MAATVLTARTLRDAIAQRTREALQCGALQPIETALTHIDDGGVRFAVREVSSLVRKEAARRTDAPAHSGSQTPRRNPFLPYDDELCVGELSSTHVALLNKYNVLDEHLLIVTRRFVPQEALLDHADFAALLVVLHGFDALGFYNGGTEAGASQPHKHLQAVPLPLDAAGAAVPVETLLDAAPADAVRADVAAADAAPAGAVGADVAGADGAATDTIAADTAPADAVAADTTAPAAAAVATVRVPGLPFAHAFAWLDLVGTADGESADRDALTNAQPDAQRALDTYRALLHAAGIGTVEVEGVPHQAAPYNLLVTRRWMLVVPREAERVEGISVNALGFAGSLFVRDAAQRETLARIGPMTALSRAAKPLAPKASAHA
ncbi:ATP adenylyltransferase family protein [Paraburkholderia oxyphila]|uniref:ATP adenylyltransferase family protein n=1 Tax=Paraburkholderia oxyphila TaxID=614212 RepID=UPI00048481BC|nr:DUF4922 domain-containing protein [Paraburkholderia oxyphila]